MGLIVPKLECINCLEFFHRFTSEQSNVHLRCFVIKLEYEYVEKSKRK